MMWSVLGGYGDAKFNTAVVRKGQPEFRPEPRRLLGRGVFDEKMTSLSRRDNPVFLTLDVMRAFSAQAASFALGAPFRSADENAEADNLLVRC
jgi:hypothetical protein